MLTGTEAAIYWERATLGVLLESPSVWSDAQLRAEDFTTKTHREIFEAICRLHTEGRDADLVEVAAEVGDKISLAYLSSLVDGVVRPNFKAYVRRVRDASLLRQLRGIGRELAEVATLAECRPLIERASDVLEPNHAN